MKHMNYSLSYLKYGLSMLLLASIFILLPDYAEAVAAPPGTCTTDPQFDLPTFGNSQGIITTIVGNITLVLGTVSANLFASIQGNYGFQLALQGAITLYIAIYGIFFAFGMVQMTLYDFVIRIIKIAVVGMLFYPTSTTFFSNTVATFFIGGTNDLIQSVTAIAVGGVQTPAGSPFGILDLTIAKVVSAKMAVTLLATAFTGPYGALFAMLLFGAGMMFAKALINALFVYLMALTLLSLLFGMAPIFLTCILFARTRHLFDGWLNQVINACLQPILLFTFFSFFVTLISAAIDNVLKVPVCWTEFSESLRGTPFNTFYWRFACKNSGGQWEPYAQSWDFSGATSSGCTAVFPLDIVNLLILLVLVEVASKFNDIVIRIANEISGSLVTLSMQTGSINKWFQSPDKGEKKDAPSAVGGRAGPPKGGVPQAATSPAGGVKGPAGGNNSTTEGSTADYIRGVFSGQTGMRGGGGK